METVEMARGKQINFRVSEDEAGRFDRVAAHYGLPVSAAIRLLVTREDQAIVERGQDRRAALFATWQGAIRTFAERVQAKRDEVVPTFWFMIEPTDPLEALGHADLQNMVRLSAVNRGGYNFPVSQYDKVFNREGFVEGVEGVEGHEHEWRAYASGPFTYVEALRESRFDFSRQNLEGRRYLHLARACDKVGMTFILARQIVERRGYAGEIHLNFGWTDTEGRKLLLDMPDVWRPEWYECREKEIRQSVTLSGADLKAAWEPIASELLTRVFALFQADRVQQAVQNNLRRLWTGQ